MAGWSGDNWFTRPCRAAKDLLGSVSNGRLAGICPPSLSRFRLAGSQGRQLFDRLFFRRQRNMDIFGYSTADAMAGDLANGWKFHPAIKHHTAHGMPPAMTRMNMLVSDQGDRANKVRDDARGPARPLPILIELDAGKQRPGWQAPGIAQKTLRD